MSSGDITAQTRIERGTEAYWHFRLAEAADDFENGIAADPQSVQARLCFGVVCFFLYQNGVSAAHQAILDLDSDRTPSREEVAAAVDRTRTLITEQNSTNGKNAEGNLQQALRLDPRNLLAMEYLAALYHTWLDPADDPLGTQHHPRSVDAQHCYERILEIDPEHRFANYVCGVVDWERAFQFMRSGSYPSRFPMRL